MALFKQTITNTGTISGTQRNWTQSVTHRASRVIDLEIEVGEGDQPIELLEIQTGSKTMANSFDDFKSLVVYNTGNVPVEFMMSVLNYYDNSNVDEFVADSGNADKWSWVSWLIMPKEMISLPNPRAVVYHTPTSSAIPSSAARAASQSSDSLKTAGSGNTYVTNTKGYFKTTDWFGMTDTAGIVPGSFWLNFYSYGYQNFGFTNSTNKRAPITSNTSTGLSTNTAYEFKLAVDGGASTRISFTTDGSNVNWGGTNGVLQKINATLLGFYNDGTLASRALAYIVNGDVRIRSGSRRSTSAIALAAGTTGTAEMFGTGNIHAVGNCDGAVAAALESATTLGLSTGSTGFYLLDRGTGVAHRALGGNAIINYDEGGTVELYNCPKDAHFSAGFTNNSAHSGEVVYHADTSNIIYKLWARSTNVKKDASIRLNGFN
jgi:hypothetical protein